ncbi:acyltransferase domain-containing protein [Renibacterium salmoninarum]|nr:acyltransferase domain-containing protein [Renibacterium salmoninarum]
MESASPDSDSAEYVDWLITLANIHDEDLAEVRELLLRTPDAAVEETLMVLRSRLGVFDPPDVISTKDELVWLEALLRFLPEQLAWYQSRGIPEAILRATVADIDRHVAISRTTKGRFSLDTWKWLTEHATGTLYQLGRLQFQLISGPAQIPGLKPEEAILGAHIPQEGPILPAAVSDSLAQAAKFFQQYFPENPVRFANCISWLLDPYLAKHLDPRSNIGQFAGRFESYDLPLDSPGDAMYFTFRIRDAQSTQNLPRETALQRLVLDRIESGGTWQVGRGYLTLPALAGIS